MDFKGKKIVVMGLGLHGGGLPVAKWFFTQGAEVIVTDLKKRDELAPTIETLDAFCRGYRLKHADQQCISVEYILGKHREEDFRTAWLVVQNPAVPKESPFLEIARLSGIPIENETSLFFQLTPHVRKIGVTGTRGKSTTATLIHQMVRRAYPGTQLTSVALPSGSRGGFEALGTTLEACRHDPSTPVVMELSSWQLEGLTSHRMSPDIAVMTNMYPDHLNRYANMEEYGDAKKTIYRYQREGDYAIFNYDNPLTRECGGEKIVGKRYWYSCQTDSIDRGAYVARSKVLSKENAIWIRDKSGEYEVCCIRDILIRGAHNVSNILAAACAAWVQGVSIEHIRAVILTFRGISSRLECLGKAGARTFYNDTAATSPEGTIVALQTLRSDQQAPIILIAGGSDKGLDFSLLAEYIRETVDHLILFTGTASPKIIASIGAAQKPTIEMAHSMDEAVGKAWQLSKEGDIILLSPAAASFGLFVNEFDRGGQFEKAFMALKKQHS